MDGSVDNSELDNSELGESDNSLRLTQNTNMDWDSSADPPWPGCDGPSGGGPSGELPWTIEQQEYIRKNMTYIKELYNYMKKCLNNGPNKEGVPKKPKGNIMYLLKNGKCPEKEQNLDSIAEMTAEEFHAYLRGLLKLFTTDRIDSQADQLPSNMKEWAASLEQAYLVVNEHESTTFPVHLNFGKKLILAKRKFDCEKKKKKQEQKISKKAETWKSWIKENTSIKEAYGRKHRAVAELIAEYPKLAELHISYTLFLEIKKKIEEVFAENVHIGQQWTMPK